MTPEQVPSIPAGVPEYVWFAAVAIAAWFARDAWPWLKAQLSAREKARLDREEREAEEDRAEREEKEREEKERYLRAFEQSSAAAAQTAAALEKIGGALDMFARADIAKTFEIAELRREVRGRGKADTPESDRIAIARMLKQEPGQ